MKACPLEGSSQPKLWANIRVSLGRGSWGGVALPHAAALQQRGQCACFRGTAVVLRSPPSSSPNQTPHHEMVQEIRKRMKQMDEMRCIQLAKYILQKARDWGIGSRASLVFGDYRAACCHCCRTLRPTQPSLPALHASLLPPAAIPPPQVVFIVTLSSSFHLALKVFKTRSEEGRRKGMQQGRQQRHPEYRCVV